MSLYDYTFSTPISYQGWIELRGLRRFPGRDATRRYDRFYAARKGRKLMRVHHDAHHIAHERYGQTVHWNREMHDPHGSIYGQIKETFSYEQAQLLYDHTDIYLYWRKPNKNITRPFYEGILRRLGYTIGRRVSNVID